MMETYSDLVAITNNGTADLPSAASSMNVNAGARIKKISVASLTVGNTYAVNIVAAGIMNPQKYLIPCNGAIPAGNGFKQSHSEPIDVDIQLPPGTSQIQIITYADVASATCKVSVEWIAP